LTSLKLAKDSIIGSTIFVCFVVAVGGVSGYAKLYEGDPIASPRKPAVEHFQLNSVTATDWRMGPTTTHVPRPNETGN
jgi:hypothetical protein